MIDKIKNINSCNGFGSVLLFNWRLCNTDILTSLYSLAEVQALPKTSYDVNGHCKLDEDIQGTRQGYLTVYGVRPMANIPEGCKLDLSA